MTEVLDFEITILTPEQAAQVWKTQSRRAPDFQRYQNFVNAHDVGTSFDIPVPGSDPANAAKIKYNFSEAARERVVTKKLPGVPDNATDAEGMDKDGTRIITAFHGADDVVYTRQDDGSYVAQVKAPVVIRWKQDQSTVKETVESDGKKGEVDVKKIHTLHGTIVNTEAVVKRGPRPKPAETSDAGASEPAAEHPPAPFEDGTTPSISDQSNGIADAAEKQPAAAGKRGK